VTVNGAHAFKHITDEQALTLAYQGLGEITYPLNAVNPDFRNEVPMVIGTDAAYKTNYIMICYTIRQSLEWTTLTARVRRCLDLIFKIQGF
jgi:hypothetical protein